MSVGRGGGYPPPLKQIPGGGGGEGLGVGRKCGHGRWAVMSGLCVSTLRPAKPKLPVLLSLL